MKSVENMKKRSAELLKKKNLEIERAKAARDQAKAAKGTAEAEKESAIKSGDVKQYQKAKADIVEAEEALELQDARLASLESKGVITPEEYQQVKDEIIQEFNTCYENEMEKMLDLITKFIEVAEPLCKVGNETSAALAYWMSDVYHDPVYRAIYLPRIPHVEAIIDRAKVIQATIETTKDLRASRI